MNLTLGRNVLVENARCEALESVRVYDADGTHIYTRVSVVLVVPPEGK